MRRIQKYNSESNLQIMVADYLRLQYPDVLFHSDFGSGVRLTPSQASIQKRQNGGLRGFPDMFIAQPKVDGVYRCYGLFLELKREDTKIFKKNGELVADAHIREQAEVLSRLTKLGYWAKFACGFNEAKQIIDEYLGGRKNNASFF